MPGTELPSDTRKVIDGAEYRVHERARRVTRRWVNHHTARLVDDEQVGVLVNDGEWYRFGGGRRWLRLRHARRDDIAVLQPPARGGGSPVYGSGAGVEQTAVPRSA